jgi:hypothetical protein
MDRVRNLAVASMLCLAFLLSGRIAFADSISIVDATPSQIQPGQTLVVVTDVYYGGSPPAQFPCPLTLTPVGQTSPVFSLSFSVPPSLWQITIPATTPPGEYLLQLACPNGITAEAPNPITVSLPSSIRFLTVTPNQVQPGQNLTVAIEYTEGSPPMQFPCPMTITPWGQTSPVVFSASFTGSPPIWIIPIPSTTPPGSYLLQLACPNGLNALIHNNCLPSTDNTDNRTVPCAFRK